MKRLIKSLFLTTVVLLFTTACSVMQNKSETKVTPASSSVVPKSSAGKSFFTRSMYESVADNADTLQLYVSDDIKFTKNSIIPPSVSINRGKLVEKSGETETEIFIKANTPVIVNKGGSSPEMLVINTGNKILNFANFGVLENGKRIDGYPNSAGGIYLPEACNNKSKTQEIDGITYNISTRCSSALLVDAKHIYNKEHKQIKAKGKRYNKTSKKANKGK